MPDPIVLEPGDQQKIISQPPQGSQWHVQVDGADVYLSHNNLAVVREGTNVLPGDRVQVKNLEGSSYYAKNPSTNSDNAEIEVSEASAFLDFLNPFSQPDVRDSGGTQRAPATAGTTTPDKRDITTYLAESVETQSTNNTTDLASGNVENVEFYAESGYVLDVFAVEVEVSNTGGGSIHELSVTDTDGSVGSLYVATDGSNGIEYNNNIVTSTVSDTVEPSTEAAQALIFDDYRIDDTNGLRFRYSNNSGATNTGQRYYVITGRKIKVS